MQIPAKLLDLFGTAIDILCQHRLGAFLPKVLARLSKRLGNASDRLGDELLAHVQPRRDLLRSLFHHRSSLARTRTSTRCTAARTRTSKPTCRFLNLIDNLSSHVVRPISYRRH
jgi:hypothetical protein